MNEYQSLTFDFTLLYPMGWEIFETSDGVMLSNNINNFITPKEEHLQNEGEFLVKISIAKNQEMVEFITAISQLKTSDNAFYIDELLNLFDNILEEDKTKISKQYQELFLKAPSHQIKFLPINNGVIVGDMKEDGHNIKVLYVLKLLEENYLVFEEIMFNTMLPNGDITNFVNVANSINIDYNLN